MKKKKFYDGAWLKVMQLSGKSQLLAGSDGRSVNDSSNPQGLLGDMGDPYTFTDPDF